MYLDQISIASKWNSLSFSYLFPASILLEILLIMTSNFQSVSGVLRSNHPQSAIDCCKEETLFFEIDWKVIWGNKTFKQNQVQLFLAWLWQFPIKLQKSWIYSNYPTTDVTFYKKECAIFFFKLLRVMKWWFYLQRNQNVTIPCP